MRFLIKVFVALTLVLLGVAAAGAAPQPEKRVAFVVGNANYAAGALPTAANDAGLVAQTLQAAGFAVIGARDLDADTFRQSYADFLKRVTDAGPGAVAFVYVAGYGLQYGNSNYYVPIGADVSRDVDIPIEAIRLSDLIDPLDALPLKARFAVFDAAYRTPFTIAGAPLPGGFALLEAGPASLVAYNAAPGTVAPVAKGNYGLYAQSLAAELREGGLSPETIFQRVRLRVDQESMGAEVPWESSKVGADFRFLDRGANAPSPVATGAQVSALTSGPLRDLAAKDAYTAALARDDMRSYAEFTTDYGGDPLAKRARALLAARREALTWQRTVNVDKPDAYWSYLGRYPRGPHATSTRLRLKELSAAPQPPPNFQAMSYDVPPPPPDEAVYENRPSIDFADPGYDFPPPPPPPDYWLPPIPGAFLDLPPPPDPVALFLLPVPVFVPIPDYDNPPPFVVFPLDDYFYSGFEGGGDVFLGDERVVNRIHGNAALGAAVALPVAVAARAAALQRRGITTPAQLNANRGGTGGAERLPGANGRPLPAQNAGRAGQGAAARQGSREGTARSNRGNGERAARPAAASRTGAASRAAGRRGSAQRQQTAGRDRAGQAQRQQTRQAQRAAQRQVRASPRRTVQRQGTQRQGTQRQAGLRRGAGQSNAQARAQGGRRSAGIGQSAARQVRAPQQVRQQQTPRQQFRGQQFRGQQFRGQQVRSGGFGGGARPGGFGGGARPGGFAGGGAAPAFGGARSGGFGGGPRPGGFGGGGAAPAFGGARPGGFGGARPAAPIGGGRPGGFGGGFRR